MSDVATLTKLHSEIISHKSGKTQNTHLAVNMTFALTSLGVTPSLITCDSFHHFPHVFIQVVV